MPAPRGPRGGDIALEGGDRGRDGGAGEIFLLVAPADGAGEDPKPPTRGGPFWLRGDVWTDSRAGERERGRLGGGGGGEYGRPDPLLGGEAILPLFLGGDPGLLDGLARGDLESRRLGGEAKRGGVDERRLLGGDLKGERDPRLRGSGDLGLTRDLSLRSLLRKSPRSLSLRRGGGDLDLGSLLGERDLSRRRAGDLGVGERLRETGRIGERDLAAVRTTTRSGWTSGDCLEDGRLVAERGGLLPPERSRRGGVLSRRGGGDLSLERSRLSGRGDGERRLWRCSLGDLESGLLPPLRRIGVNERLLSLLLRGVLDLPLSRSRTGDLDRDLRRRGGERDLPLSPKGGERDGKRRRVGT